MGVNKLVGDAGSQRAVADESAADEVLPADLVLESIGYHCTHNRTLLDHACHSLVRCCPLAGTHAHTHRYKSLPLTGVPFDDSNAVLRNEGGVIVDGDGKQG